MAHVDRPVEAPKLGVGGQGVVLDTTQNFSLPPATSFSITMPNPCA